MEMPRHWRNGQTMKAFVGEKCENGHVSLFPRKVCRECQDNQKPAEVKSDDITIFSSRSLLYTSDSYMEVQQRQ